MAWNLPLIYSSPISSPLLSPIPRIPYFNCRPKNVQFPCKNTTITTTIIKSFANGGPTGCQAQNKKSSSNSSIISDEDGEAQPQTVVVRRAQQVWLWASEAAYIIWLFLLPYAPGDPVWAITSTTVNDLIGLSLNFFFILPILNYAGIVEAPVLHPVSEGLFNFVIGWTLLFAPLLFTDRRRNRYRGSLDVLWGFQMFLTNTFLIPYMAIRLNDMDSNRAPAQPTRLASLMINGASIVGIIGGAVCVFSAFWALFARNGGGFGGFEDRWEYFVSYIGSERLAYAFLWDICLYAIFQPWLIGDNLQNVKQSNRGIVKNTRFIPVLGLVAYLLSLDSDNVLD